MRQQPSAGRVALVIVGLVFVMVAALATMATVKARRDALVEQLRQHQVR
jgi:uncharacterized membrane protein (Fun14 family)